MARLLLIAVIGAVLWLLYKGFSKSFKVRDKPNPQDESAVEAMVKCSRCGVNLPSSEARLVNGEYECADSASCSNRT